MAWAPPPDAYGIPAAGGLEYAGAVPRIVAWIVDSLILGFVTVLLGIAAVVVFGTSDSGSAAFGSGFPGAAPGRTSIPSLVAFVVGLAIQLLYFVFLWTSGGRATVGMRLLGLQVANAVDGATLTRLQGVRRWFALGPWLGLLGYIPVVAAIGWLVQLVWVLALLVTTASSPTKQGLHDRLAQSVVVQRRGGSTNGLLVGCLLIVALLILLPIIAFAALILLGGQISDILENVATSV